MHSLLSSHDFTMAATFRTLQNCIERRGTGTPKSEATHNTLLAGIIIICQHETKTQRQLYFPRGRKHLIQPLPFFDFSNGDSLSKQEHKNTSTQNSNKSNQYKVCYKYHWLTLHDKNVSKRTTVGGWRNCRNGG
jgi:hypothetical protein